MAKILIDYTKENRTHATRLKKRLTRTFRSKDILLAIEDSSAREVFAQEIKADLLGSVVYILIVSQVDLYQPDGSRRSYQQFQNSLPDRTKELLKNGGSKLILTIVQSGNLSPQEARSPYLQFTDWMTFTLSQSSYSEDLEHLASEVESRIQLAESTSDSQLWASHHPNLVDQFSNPAGSEHAQESDANPSPDEGVEVKWSTDAATSIDLLRRDALARVLDARLREANQDQPHTSLLVHLDGNWGSGKSTILMLLAKHLTNKPPFLLVWFDAWQQSRVSPPWWALLTTLRQHILADRNWFTRTWLRSREMWARMRVSGAPYTVALILISILSVGVGYATRWLAIRYTPTISDLVKLFTPAIAMVAFLWAGSRVAARVFLWTSAGGARLFEQSNSNPMARVALHFDWLLKRSKKPVVFFIDDLDRCREDYVVEFLDSVHTLVRDASRSHYRPSTKRSTPAAYFVVAADGAWIRQSYEHAYKTFEPSVSSSGGSLGYLFMDKLFQLNVPMPALGGTTQKAFMGELLGLAQDDAKAQLASASAAIEDAAGNEAAIIETLENLSPDTREAVAGEAALALASAHVRQHSEHTLRKFSPMLHGNPRSIKLFLNTYSMLRSVRTLEGSTVAPETLALWALIRVRWPSIADVLQRSPEAIEGIKDDLWCADHFPEDLHSLAKSKELRRVVLHEPGGPLSAALIRQCCGTVED